MHIDPRLDELPLSHELAEPPGADTTREVPDPPAADAEDRPAHRSLRLLRVLMDE